MPFARLHDLFDTHPALSERIAALQDLPPGRVDPDAEAPAISLLEDLPAVERELLRHLMVDSSQIVEAALADPRASPGRGGLVARGDAG